LGRTEHLNRNQNLRPRQVVREGQIPPDLINTKVYQANADMRAHLKGYLIVQPCFRRIHRNLKRARITQITLNAQQRNSKHIHIVQPNTGQRWKTNGRSKQKIEKTKIDSIEHFKIVQKDVRLSRLKDTSQWTKIANLARL
jgi:hypothetical protein